jgi:hypothetical protein
MLALVRNWRAKEVRTLWRLGSARNVESPFLVCCQVSPLRGGALFFSPPCGSSASCFGSSAERAQRLSPLGLLIPARPGLEGSPVCVSSWRNYPPIAPDVCEHGRATQGHRFASSRSSDWDRDRWGSREGHGLRDVLSATLYLHDLPGAIGSLERVKRYTGVSIH